MRYRSLWIYAGLLATQAAAAQAAQGYQQIAYAPGYARAPAPAGWYGPPPMPYQHAPGPNYPGYYYPRQPGGHPAAPAGAYPWPSRASQPAPVSQSRPPAAATASTAAPVAAAPSQPAAPTDPTAALTRIVEGEPAVEASQDQPDSKQAFFAKLRPLIKVENDRLRKLRKTIQNLLAKIQSGHELEDADSELLQALATEYRVEGDPLKSESAQQELLKRVDVIPMSLALAQAANESAWGKSRFAREGNNLFGIWTYDEDKGIVPKQRSNGKTHLVRKFDDLAESVRYYIWNLNSHPAYAEMRELRQQQRESGEPIGHELAAGLKSYSAKGERYVSLIQQLIDRHDLAALDNRNEG